MKLPSLSEIGKGPLFEQGDIMGLGDSHLFDENWSTNKEEEIVSKIRNGEIGLSDKSQNLKLKIMNGRDKIINSEVGMKEKVFSNTSFNFKMNTIPRGGNMNNKKNNFDNIMGMPKQSMSYQNKVEMIMGKKSSGGGGGFDVKAFDNKAKAYLGMSGGNMKNPMQKTNMLNGKSSMPKNMNMYFGGVQKPKENFNIQNLISGAKSKGNVDIQRLISGAGKVPVNMPRGNVTVQKPEDKISAMFGQNMMGAKQTEVLARMGMYQRPEQMAWGRLNMQKKLDLWGDADGDKVSNILDCQPLNAKMQGFWGDVGSAITRTGRGAANYVKYGQTLGGYEAGEGVKSRAEQWAEKDIEKGRERLMEEEKEPSIVKKDIGIVAEKTGGFLSGVGKVVKGNINVLKYGQTYGGDSPPEGAETLREKSKREKFGDKLLTEQRKYNIEAAKYGGPEELEAQRQREQVIKLKELEFAKVSPESRAKLLKAEADMIRARKVTGTIKGKKGKYQDVYGPVEESSRGALSAFGSSGGFYQMTQNVGGGISGFDIVPKPSGMGFAQMADTRMMSSGQGFSEMSNIRPVQGSGFHQMLGVQPPMQQMQPEQMEEQMEESSMEQGATGQSMIMDGVEYLKLPSGKWKNTKTGKEVRYPRGKYSD